MSSDALDDAQLSALKASVQLIEAGPGAGKTRTIVERMKRHANDMRKGVALISFTNTAADEAKRRCAPAQLASPNYVGTVDSFLHRFIVTPEVSLKNSAAPKYVTSWNDLPESAIMTRLNGVSGGSGFRLGSFRTFLDGRIDIGSSPSREDSQYLAACVKAGRRDELVALGQKRVEGYLKSGTFDSDGARLRALEILSNSNSVVAKRLASRFDEIIIDEFQDCSDVEVAIVERLKYLGINVVVVADPDQAIYEFRDAFPDSYREYRDSLDDDAVVLLEKNYRSSPAICELVAMLRSVGTGDVVSNRPEIQHKVVVLAGSPVFQRAQFADRLTACEIPVEDAIVLAHEKKQASTIAGRTIENPAFSKSSHKTFGLLGSVIAIRDAEGPLLRKAAIDRAQRIILGLFRWNYGENGLAPVAQLELLEVTRGHIASSLLGILADSEHWIEVTDATASIRSQVKAHFGALPRELSKPSTALRALDGDHWKVWAESQEGDSRGDSSYSCSHIHAVKGNEYRAVLLSIKKQRGKDYFWDIVRSGKTDESLRVLYVGASRAAELLVLGCSAKEVSKLTELLKSEGIEYDLLKEGKAST
ncbi:MAG: UvrD-helicase domain-containing protein [Leucobacter sp.]